VTRAPAPGRVGYFGKIATRSDFIKAAPDVALMGVLDGWLAQIMAELPSDPRWKLHYDALAPVHFVFVGPRRKHAIAGHIVASRDQSGRRFPFLTVRTLELANPASFAARCPIVLEPLWNSMQDAAREVLLAPDPTALLQAIADMQVTLDESDGAALATFLATGTVASLAALLGRADLRQLLLALGLLLQPALEGGIGDLDKSLVLPLPDHACARAAVAAFWLDLVLPFLGKADVELALFVATIALQPVLVIGFRGASAHTLRAIVDPLFGAEHQVSFADVGWVDEQLGVDIDMRALASYLDQPQLPLKLARELFLQTFTGAAP